MQGQNYEAAYYRQKKAREIAEDLLENRSRELFESNQSLSKAYEKLKNQKTQLIHQEKLASIGQLSAGVAHEINNPAGFIKSNLSSLKRYVGTITDYAKRVETVILAGDGEPKELYEKIKEESDIDYILGDLADLVNDSLEGIERMTSIVKNLKDFSRPDTEKTQCYDINKCMQSTLKLASREIKYRADIEESYDDLPAVLGQPGSMGQVFLNLVMNAAQAIDVEKSGKGKIKISTQKVSNHIEVIVEDNGIGIPEHLQKKVFDPFFTSKKAGHGTGLGLSISDSIIRKQNGTITIQSEEGEGTRFCVQLPLSVECADLVNLAL